LGEKRRIEGRSKERERDRDKNFDKGFTKGENKEDQEALIIDMLYKIQDSGKLWLVDPVNFQSWFYLKDTSRLSDDVTFDF
jgi:hypothetical protein